MGNSSLEDELKTVLAKQRTQDIVAVFEKAGIHLSPNLQQLLDVSVRAGTVPAFLERCGPEFKSLAERQGHQIVEQVRGEVETYSQSYTNTYAVRFNKMQALARRLEKDLLGDCVVKPQLGPEGVVLRVESGKGRHLTTVSEKELDDQIALGQRLKEIEAEKAKTLSATAVTLPVNGMQRQFVKVRTPKTSQQDLERILDDRPPSHLNESNPYQGQALEKRRAEAEENLRLAKEKEAREAKRRKEQESQNQDVGLRPMIKSAWGGN